VYAYDAIEIVGPARDQIWGDAGVEIDVGAAKPVHSADEAFVFVGGEVHASRSRCR